MNFWQETDNSEWFSDEKIKCSICNKKINHAVEFKLSQDDTNPIYVCFNSMNHCFYKGQRIKFSEDESADYLLTRSIVFMQLKKERERRPPIGLSLRYNILKRDGFQCVLCGASGAKSKLEIDHIIPVSKNGCSNESNLRTLCFNCNRGKRDKI